MRISRLDALGYLLPDAFRRMSASTAHSRATSLACVSVLLLVVMLPGMSVLVAHHISSDWYSVLLRALPFVTIAALVTNALERVISPGRVPLAEDVGRERSRGLTALLLFLYLLAVPSILVWLLHRWSSEDSFLADVWGLSGALLLCFTFVTWFYASTRARLGDYPDNLKTNALANQLRGL